MKRFPFAAVLCSKEVLSNSGGGRMKSSRSTQPSAPSPTSLHGHPPPLIQQHHPRDAVKLYVLFIVRVYCIFSVIIKKS